MAIDDLLNLAKGLLDGWNNGKLKRTLKQTAQVALDKSVEVSQLEEKLRQKEDEIRRLKGEKSKPEIKPTNTSDLNPAPKKNHQKKHKKSELEIDQRIETDIDKEDLPKDAKFIGTRKIVIQEMIIKRNNIEFTINRYWSAELGRVIESKVPESFQGSEFGPALRSFILYQYYKNRVPHLKIIQMLSDWGIEISKGTVCNILNKNSEIFIEDLSSARSAAIKRSSQVHIDETGARFAGTQAYTFGASNKFFTSFTTGFEKNRWAAVGALLGGSQTFLVSREAVSFIARKLKKPQITNYFSKLESEKFYSRRELEDLFKDRVFEELTKNQLDVVRTGCAIGAIRSRLIGSPIKFLITDDAPNFVNLIENHQLCWVHEIRKYKLCEVWGIICD